MRRINMSFNRTVVGPYKQEQLESITATYKYSSEKSRAAGKYYKIQK